MRWLWMNSIVYLMYAIAILIYLAASVQRWILAQPDKAAISASCEQMVHSDTTESHHKEHSKSRFAILHDRT